jgi:uncharacterized protein Yka (UPF0111/DUF47 family)
VNPDGNDFFHLGICCFNLQSHTYVEGRESIYEWLPPQDGLYKDAWLWGPNLSFHAVNLIRKYGPFDTEQFQTRMIERARAWGFNSAGGFSGIAPDQVAIAKNHFPYVANLPTENMSYLVNAIFDPFDEATRASFDKQCAAQLVAQANDPQLIGYFISNEPYVEEIPRVISTLKGNAVKVRLVQFLQEKHKSIDAFVEQDSQLAREVCADDDSVDELNREIIQELIGVMQKSPKMVEPAMHLFSAARHVERVADHATNIAEDVIYLVEGEIVRHRTFV